MSELAASIRAQGLKQELLVTPVSGHDGVKYRLVIGHRRFAACLAAGLERVPCKVEELDERAQREIMLVENSQRADLTPLEEADGYQELLDLGAGVDDMAEMTGRSQSFVRGRLKIARIPESVRARSEAFAQLSLSQLDDLARFEDRPDLMGELAGEAGTANWAWKVNQLQRRLQIEQWQAGIRATLDDLGVDVDGSGSGYGAPDGYRYCDVFTGAADGFADWWKQWRSSNSYGTPLVRLDEQSVLCFPQLSPDELAERTATKERRDREWERAKEREAKAARFAHDSRLLRTLWIHDHAPHYTARQLRDASTRLGLLVLTGDDHNDGLICGCSWNNSRKVIDAYNELTSTPLPASGDEEHPYCEENLTELHLRQQVTGAEGRELLLILCAQTEALITYSTWVDKDDITLARAYYAVLDETLGYPTSDEERQALAGGLCDEGDER